LEYILIVANFCLAACLREKVEKEHISINTSTSNRPPNKRRLEQPASYGTRYCTLHKTKKLP